MASLFRPTLLRQAGLARHALARPAAPSTIARVAAFHASSRRSLLPPGPLNDAAPVPSPSPSHGSYHWTFERLIAAGLVPLSVAPFAGGSVSPVLDAALCSLLLLHTHLGFQAILIDYVPNSRYPGMRKALTWLLNGATLLVGVGLYEYETNDIGLTETVKRVWTA
ncbi:CybS-domain-containing protein [Microdochium trichocladiopsis]|uniref:Succinate dehydrogenase [ubiquinone] cytochrome b small subunit n=1 Tax=Microdochium trichocladiopsis TaxID=1682393 RepID=A0A9P8XY23_9PEZI|nr:CybS-domain-containing protein [Microdochium trichocladiopsis]KAH7018553.1 CybS-domain-containing protein [Microdochium trichocladiopsis]